MDDKPKVWDTITAINADMERLEAENARLREALEKVNGIMRNNTPSTPAEHVTDELLAIWPTIEELLQ